MLEFFQILPMCAFLTPALCLACSPLSFQTKFPVSLSTSLLSGTTIYSRLLFFLCPIPGSHHFFKGLWFPFTEIVFRNQTSCYLCS